MTLEINKIYNMDCLEGLKLIPDNSIDMVLCDLPYGTTACKWDNVLPFNKLWEQYKRIIKDNGAIVLTAIQPFTSEVVMSNKDMFRTEWIWQKAKAKNYVQARNHPLKYHENILVFGKSRVNYFPIMREGKPYKKVQRQGNKSNAYLKDTRKNGFITLNNGTRFPSSIIYCEQPEKECYHPTQKPVKLFKYLIETYTKEGDLVLDNCIGSGTTAIAALNTKRNFIGFEISKEYCDIANKRLQQSTLNEVLQ